jgi:D-3-phosphoglycerate dehydrogenase / 2-oxoglutarate reductase
MSYPVILIADELSPATVDALGPDCQIRYVDGTDRPALLAALAHTSAIIVRSATQVDAQAIASAPHLAVIARAGVGLDNGDVKAATAAGVMVVNAPTSNIISAAELTVAHILNLARHVPAASHALSQGEWQRSRYVGVELYEKTVGIVGLGRIGTLVAERLRAFGVDLLAYDPYVAAAHAGQLGVQLVLLDELLSRSDFLTIHMPKSPETVGMIGAQQLARMKASAYLINVARGGLVDEEALSQALSGGIIAGAGLDVFVHEPPAGSPLLGLSNVVATPHLGASTREAQERAGVSVARSVRLALAGELVPDVVNVAGGAIDPYVRPSISLIEKLGQVFSALAHGSLASIDVLVRGELAEYDVDSLRLAALKGVFSGMVSETVSYVNALLLAEQRGIAVRLLTDSVSEEYRNVLTLQGTLSDGSRISVSGTLVGRKQMGKIVEINGYDVEVSLATHLLVMVYEDRPGVVAIYGKEFGDANINIAGMSIARNALGGRALSVIELDSSVPDGVVERIGARIVASFVRMITITQ